MSTWAKSTARIAWACAARNCRQVGPDRSGAGSMPAVFRIFQMVEAATLVAESDELALDASVAPGRVLAGHPQYQGPDRLRGGWAARLASRVGPAAGDEAGVPAQQGSRRHQPQPAQLRGQQPAQRAEERAVDPAQRRAWVVSAQHGNLVAEHQDLDVLGCVGPGEQRQPALGVAAGLSGRTTVERACRPGRSRRGSRRLGCSGLSGRGANSHPGPTPGAAAGGGPAGASSAAGSGQRCPR